MSFAGQSGPRRGGAPVLFAFVLLVLSASAGVAAETRIALVIGNGAYREAPLKNPPNDARLIADTLKRLGFTVIGAKPGEPLIDADQKTMKRAIRSFGEQLERVGSEGVGLFFYAGHAVQTNGKNYLIPVGADITGEADLEVDAVSADSVMVRMTYAGARMNLVVLDACRNNPYRGRFRSPTRGLAEMSAPRGSLVAYSTAPGDVAEDGAGKNSPYSTALAEAMAVTDLPVELAFKRVRYAVMQATGNRQVPWESSSLIGDFYFAQTVLVPPPAQQPAAKLPPVVATIPSPAAIPKTAGAAMDTQEVFGLLERAKNDDTTAVDELRRNADAGDPVAQTGLATVYLAGLGGVAKDDAEAARLTRLAADQGFPPAEYDLALLYFTGRGVPKDVEESARWLEKAANRGIVPAQNNLGLLYAVGQGVPKDLKKSAALFRKAADQGFAEAQNNLGVLYANGEGVKKDPKEAKKWFDKAAAQGHSGAQRNIEMLQQQQ